MDSNGIQLFCFRWAFAGGVYMMELSASGDLRLTAIYGLVIATAVIATGAAIGRWIDNTRRLTGWFLHNK